ncbi:MAG: DNRLRE domain-containing protein [Paludibacter sp.]
MKRKNIAIVTLLICSAQLLKANDFVSINCTKDNNIIQSATGVLSNGTGNLTAGRTNQDATATPVLSIRRAMIYFDVAGNVPANSTIDSVRLSMYFSKTSGTEKAVVLHRVQKEWGEGTSYFNGGQGAPATQNDATWLYTYYNLSSPTTSTAWTIPGGDFDSEVAASVLCGVDGSYGIKSWSSAIMKAHVQTWLNTPGQNFGWLLQGDESTGQTSKQFYSREWIDPALRPILKVYYSQAITTGLTNLHGNTFSICPNPAVNEIRLSFEEPATEKISVFNTMGALIKTIETNNQQVISADISDLKTGIYILKSGSYTARLIKK